MKTEVITPEGFKSLSDVCEGDKLLTHKDRFRAVSNVELIDVDKLYEVKLRHHQNFIVSSKQDLFVYTNTQELFHFTSIDEIDLDNYYRTVIPVMDDTYKKFDDKKWSRFHKLNARRIIDKIIDIVELTEENIIKEHVDYDNEEDLIEEIKYVKGHLEDYPDIKEDIEEMERLKRNYPKVIVEQDESYCYRGGLVSCFVDKEKMEELSKQESEEENDYGV